jgi:hypothetical protein
MIIGKNHILNLKHIARRAKGPETDKYNKTVFLFRGMVHSSPEFITELQRVIEEGSKEAIEFLEEMKAKLIIARNEAKKEAEAL